MKLPRRNFLHLTAGATALPAVSRIARAETYPSRPVRILVGFPPGSAPDIVARLLGQQLSDRLGQPFVIDNRPGASSNIATEAVVHAAPDGYTLLVVSLANVFNATLYDKLNFDFIRDIAPIASIDRQPFVLETHPSVPARTVPEFIAYAKANPGKINMASAGAGSAYACGHRRTAQPGDQCESHEPRDESEIPRFGRYSVYQSAGRIWQAPHLRNREVGQGDPGCQHQGGMNVASLAFQRGTLMKLPRRNFLHLAAGAAALPVVPCIAWAQAYPTRPVRIVVGFAAGGAGDIAARLMGQWLSERLGQQFVIDNRPRGGGNTGT